MKPAFATIIVTGILMLTWGIAYVSPMDQHRDRVQVCMDSNKASKLPKATLYRQCHNALIRKAGGLVPFFHPAEESTSASSN